MATRLANVLVAFALSSLARAHAATDVPVEAWHAIAAPRWEGIAAGPGRYELGGDVVRAFLDPARYAGGWLRARASASADMPDFNVWITGLDEKMMVRQRSLPSTCRVADGRKTCSNVSWIAPGSPRLAVTFWSGGNGALDPGPIESARGGDIAPANERRWRELADAIQDLYLDGDAVDWPRVRDASHALLAAPPDIDPLPAAIAALIRSLPDNRHMAIVRRPGTGSPGDAAPLPTCTAGSDGAWVLALPGTPRDADAHARYRASAHACLATPGVRHWRVDLTQDNGGDARLQLAALQPILGTGPQLKFRDAHGALVVVALQPTAVTVGGVVQDRWATPQPPVHADVTFVIGPGCASACEEVALAARGRFRLVGQPTAGLTSVNEPREINDALMVQITSAKAVDLQDRAFERIEPDEPLAAWAVAALLRPPASSPAP